MISKLKLIYVSPVWPMESGISQYSECLLKELTTRCEVTLVVDGYIPEHQWLMDSCRIIQYSNNMVLPEYDMILYNFGNHPHFHAYMYSMIMDYPGYVILHDFSLYYLTIGYYQSQGKVLQKILELEGIDSFQKIKRMQKKARVNLLGCKDLAEKMCLNKEILKAAKGIIVHSQYTADRIRTVMDKDILVIPHLYNIDTSTLVPDAAKQMYKIPDDAVVIGSAGFISESKLNHLICKAVKRYNESHDSKLYYLMIGQGDYVDSYLDPYIIKTGFVDNDVFFSLLNRCDLVFNLRNPYQGESSGPLTQAMALGKICVVTNVGSFAEFPDDTVVKTEETISEDAILSIIEDTELRVSNMGNLARQYIEEECNVAKIADRILGFVTGGFVQDGNK